MIKMLLEQTLRMNLLKKHFNQMMNSTVKFLFQRCEFDGSKRWAAIHNKLVDVFGTGMTWKEDQDKIRDNECIQPITKEDAEEYKHAIQEKIVEMEKQIAFLKSKETALHDLLNGKIECYFG